MCLCDGLDVGRLTELRPQVRHEKIHVRNSVTLLIEGELQRYVNQQVTHETWL